MPVSTIAISLDAEQKKLLITANSQGTILINENSKNHWASALNMLKLLLYDLYYSHGIKNPRKEAIKTILEIEIKEQRTTVKIEVHNDLRIKFPRQEYWEIPIDLFQMKRFIDDKMPK
ncbi:MAG: hypothetical protein UR60_C0049G0003 [Candidatus Moranbacteria bacterium GW2011_GWF2_34_56]|nr:MAG: hypothetical protein UR51_C0002G0127 [Candidatus Moranbacteria bacterium GW2011_GWF1_34_10]KKP63018.1 MAG: hypothetical protein UR60_C0049G0003 [Candidatus Moranbacteria bacterium GW2011_GWF2_34_56]HBI17055.1 hypothetical protein [Candidatus Moranbacteria bacterium]